MKKLNVLVACEESQAVCIAFRNLGHNAYSCDLQPCSGGHPEWHIHGDCIDAITTTGWDNHVTTSDGVAHAIDHWDLIVAHPPCTFLARSGQRFCNEFLYGDRAIERQRDREEAKRFFLRLLELSSSVCSHTAIENPVGIIDEYVHHTQLIHPWQFGDNVHKQTCLWLNGLPTLIPDVAIEPERDLVHYVNRHNEVRSMERFFYDTRFLPAAERRKQRSKTFQGIARAMAAQWSAAILSEAS